MCEFLCADALTHPFSKRFDVVVALGVFDYLRDPHSLLCRMIELAEGKVIASFPGWSPVRAPLRKARYWLRDCPVYFSTLKRLHQVCQDSGLQRYELVPCGGRAGWLVIGLASERSMSGSFS
jgi:hypothetical protein